MLLGQATRNRLEQQSGRYQPKRKLHFHPGDVMRHAEQNANDGAALAAATRKKKARMTETLDEFEDLNQMTNEEFNKLMDEF